MMFFWGLAPFGVVGRCQRFGEHTVSIFTAEVAMLHRHFSHIATS
jgi:hypothetical protein